MGTGRASTTDFRPRRVLVAGFLGAAIGIIAAGGAWAQSLTGGCAATINGKTPTQLTKDAPLAVAEGDNVVLKGTAPSSVAGGRSSTRVKVETPAWLPDMPFGPYKGKGTAWGGTVEVPKILFTLGSGIYKVNGTATGTGGWRCIGSAYVQLGDSSPIEAAVGGAAALGGGAIALSGRKPKNKDENSLGRAIVNLIKELGPDIKASFGADGFLLIALLLLFVLLGILGLPA